MSLQSLQEAAEELVLVVERLHRTRRIRIELFGQPLRNRLTIELADMLNRASQIDDRCGSDAVLEVLTLIDTMDVQPCLIDVGDFILRFDGKPNSMRSELQNVNLNDEPRPVIINGFGRVGRMLVRQFIREGCQPFLELKGIRVRPGADLRQRAALFRYDSIHGTFPYPVSCDPEGTSMTVGDQKIEFYVNEEDDEDPDYGDDIHNALMIETTGSLRDQDALSSLMDSQVNQVLITAPGRDVPGFIYGVSDLQDLMADCISASSCTSNAACVLLSCLDEQMDLQHVHMEAVHAYTNDQNLFDNVHAKSRRSRAATQNIIPASSGAEEAVTAVLPQLEGRFSMGALRVPVADVSVLACSLQLEKPTTSDELANLFRSAAESPRYRQLIGVSEEPEAASCDFIGTRRTCVVDLHSIRAEDERCTFYAWYDNEAGYCAQVLRLAQCTSAEVAPMLCYGPMGMFSED